MIVEVPELVVAPSLLLIVLGALAFHAIRRRSPRGSVADLPDSPAPVPTAEARIYFLDIYRRDHAPLPGPGHSVSA